MTSSTPSGVPSASAIVRALLIPAIAALAGLVVLLSLGFWQLERLSWKDVLIAKVSNDVALPAVPAPAPFDWPDMDHLEWDYRHVSVAGHFLNGAAYYYTALGKANGPFEGPGFMVYSPFQTHESWVVLINRGFIPQGLSDDDRKSIIVVPGEELKLTGLLRRSEKPNWTTPDVDPNSLIWFARDTGHMADALDISDMTVAPFSIDLGAEFTPESGLPQAGETVVQFKNDHLGYALTWFGLAATLAGVFLTYAAGTIWNRGNENGSR